MSYDRDRRRRVFEILVLPHREAIYALALRLAGDRPDADQVVQELVQEVYLRAFRYFHSFHGDDVMAWMRVIVVNAFTTWRRRESATRLIFVGSTVNAAAKTREPLWCSGSYDPEWLLITNTDSQRLFALVETLPPTFRQVLLLREVEELSYSDIAAAAGIPVGTVMSRLARARTALRRLWLKKNGAMADGALA